MTFFKTTDEILDEAADRAATAYSRSGNLIGPDQLDEELAALAGKAERELRRFRDALRAGRDHELGYPVAEVQGLLAVIAALRAAMRYTPTPTAVEIVDRMRAEDRATHDGDNIRLHLASTHGFLPALGMTDREAVNEHDRRHAAGYPDLANGDPHTRDGRAWTAGQIRRNILTRSEWSSRQFDAPLEQHLARVSNPDGASREYDVLRLHLLAEHGNLCALGLADVEAAEEHERGHHGPCTIRNHPFESTTWAKKAERVVDAALLDKQVLTVEDREALRLRFAAHRARVSEDPNLVVAVVDELSPGLPARCTPDGYAQALADTRDWLAKDYRLSGGETPPWVIR